jgi:hypothetical protein
MRRGGCPWYNLRQYSSMACPLEGETQTDLLVLTGFRLLSASNRLYGRPPCETSLRRNFWSELDIWYVFGRNDKVLICYGGLVGGLPFGQRDNILTLRYLGGLPSTGTPTKVMLLSTDCPSSSGFVANYSNRLTPGGTNRGRLGSTLRMASPASSDVGIEERVFSMPACRLRPARGKLETMGASRVGRLRSMETQVNTSDISLSDVF